ncbi:MAG: membrane lipoprotein lipid attachment site-containing protein [Muribaculaceae bacterium]|nr:membrane lipoprotein lipid attachment site-containing protein [Muribaculaceae bacterium]
MKKIIPYIALILLLLTGCSKEKDYYFTETISQNVNFTATNLTVGEDNIDSANSIKYTYDFSSWEEREENVNFTITYRYKNEDGYVSDPTTENIYLYEVNALWIGGNNDIRITFIPSCPEEKSAQFTFPDGTKQTLTVENPSYVWRLDKDNVTRLNNLGRYGVVAPIYAISRYEKNGINHINSGFIRIYNDAYYLQDMLYYDSTLNQWFMGDWLN